MPLFSSFRTNLTERFLPVYLFIYLFFGNARYIKTPIENILYKMTLHRFLTSLLLQSTLPEIDTFRTSTKCSAWRDVRLIDSQIKGVKKGRDQH